MLKSLNKYDICIFLLIASLAAGQMGGALQPVRILSLIFLPVAFVRFPRLNTKYVGQPKKFIFFCLFWGVLSLSWTYNINRGLEEIIYYFVHFSLCLELIIFSLYANKPLKSIALGWLCALVIVSTIALWELITYNHLRYSKFAEGLKANHGGEIMLKQFAAATFYNYNYLGLFNCYCAPFVIYLLLKSPNKYEVLICFSLLALSTYIAILNASRGAILTMSIFMFIVIINVFKRKGAIRYFSILIIFLFFVIFIENYETIMMNIQLRMLNTTMLDGTSRFGVWMRALDCLGNSLGLGTGVGGLEQGMREVSLGYVGAIACHNMFIEIAIGLGLIVFAVFIVFILRLFKKVLFCKSFEIRVSMLGAFISMPIYSIINSEYLVHAGTYLFFTSLYIFINNEHCKHIN